MRRLLFAITVAALVSVEDLELLQRLEDESDIKAARKALESGSWKKMDAADRGRLMFKLADLIEKEAGEFDTIVESNGVRVFVDPTSMMYLSGATIDYVDSLMGGGFRIENPNAVSTCGCGHSFKTSGQAGASSGDSCGHH